MLEYIFENDMEGTDEATKAVVREILSDIIEYAKNVLFIPFKKLFKIISGIYEQNQMPELALLKTKLIKYDEEGIFAENEDDILKLDNSIKSNLQSYIDIADVSESLQKELISYIHNRIEQTGEYIYTFVKLNNHNSNKQLLLKLTNSKNIFTTLICSHSYKYVQELKQLADNIVLFAPQTDQHDFANYNTFLSKLNKNEFVVCGNLTQNIPFITELADLNEMQIAPDISENSASVDKYDNKLETSEQAYEESQNLNEDNIEIQEFESNNTDSRTRDEIVEKVAKDVDEVLFENKIDEIQPIDNLLYTSDENLTEEDLDFIEELPQDTETIITEPTESEDITTDFSITNESAKSETPLTSSVEDELLVEEPAADMDINLSNENPFEFNEEVAIESNDTFDGPLNLDEQVPMDDLQVNDDIPIFSADDTQNESQINFEQGDEVSHPKYGKGVIEKLIKYGNKTLCSIAFEEVGRRLLDPSISELQKL